MPRLIASSPQAEALGVQVLALLNSILKEDFAPILQAHGLEHIEPDRWYSQQLILDIVKDILSSQLSKMESMVSLGMAVKDTVPGLPPDATLAQVLAGLNAIHHRVNRNIPDAEGYDVRILGPGHARVTNNTPYPDTLIYGLLWNIARGRVANGNFTVQMLSAGASAAEDEPATFDITWEA